MSLNQNEIDELINSLKRLLIDDNIINIPNSNSKELLEGKSAHSEIFLIDLNRKGRKIKRYTLQLRPKRAKELPLLRLDLIGPDHPNPPGNFPYSDQTIPCPHLHIAHEGFGDSIAVPLNTETANLYLSNEELQDFVKVTKTFLKRCNIINVEDFRFSSTQENLSL